MARAEPQFLVKVLSGPHFGAEVELPAGEFRFGRGADCDVVVTDTTVAEEHLTLAVDANGVKVVAIASPVLVAGQAVEVGAELPFFSVLAIGTTQIAIGPLDDPWPTLDELGVADDQERWKRFKAVAPSNVPHIDELGLAVPGPSWWQRPEVRLARAAVIGLALAAVIALPLRYGGERAAAVQTAFIGMFDSVGARLTGALQGGEEAVADELTLTSPEATPAQRLATLLAELQLSDLEVRQDSRDRWIIDGVVDDAATRARLAQRLREEQLPVQLRVFTGEQMVASATQTLAALKADLQVSYAGHGQLEVAGYMEDPGRLEEVLEILKRDVGGVREIKPAIVTSATVVTALREELQRNQLADTIRLGRDGDALVAQGAVGPEQVAAWESVRDWYDATYGEHVKLIARVAQGASRAAPPPGVEIEVRAVGHKPMPYVVLADGQKYLEGSLLADGSMIESIKPGVIVLSREGRTYEYRYRL